MLTNTDQLSASSNDFQDVFLNDTVRSDPGPSRCMQDVDLTRYSQQDVAQRTHQQLRQMGISVDNTPEKSRLVHY